MTASANVCAYHAAAPLVNTSFPKKETEPHAKDTLSTAGGKTSAINHFRRECASTGIEEQSVGSPIEYVDLSSDAVENERPAFFAKGKWLEASLAYGFGALKPFCQLCLHRVGHCSKDAAKLFPQERRGKTQHTDITNRLRTTAAAVDKADVVPKAHKPLFVQKAEDGVSTDTHDSHAGKISSSTDEKSVLEGHKATHTSLSFSMHPPERIFAGFGANSLHEGEAECQEICGVKCEGRGAFLTKDQKCSWCVAERGRCATWKGCERDCEILCAEGGPGSHREQERARKKRQRILKLHRQGRLDEFLSEAWKKKHQKDRHERGKSKAMRQTQHTEKPPMEATARAKQHYRHRELNDSRLQQEQENQIAEQQRQLQRQQRATGGLQKRQQHEATVMEDNHQTQHNTIQQQHDKVFTGNEGLKAEPSEIHLPTKKTTATRRGHTSSSSQMPLEGKDDDEERKEEKNCPGWGDIADGGEWRADKTAKWQRKERLKRSSKVLEENVEAAASDLVTYKGEVSATKEREALGRNKRVLRAEREGSNLRRLSYQITVSTTELENLLTRLLREEERETVAAELAKKKEARRRAFIEQIEKRNEEQKRRGRAAQPTVKIRENTSGAPEAADSEEEEEELLWMSPRERFQRELNHPENIRAVIYKAGGGMRKRDNDS